MAALFGGDRLNSAPMGLVPAIHVVVPGTGADTEARTSLAEFASRTYDAPISRRRG
jgi:hypothetical protein